MGTPVKSVLANHFTNRRTTMPNRMYDTWKARIRELRPGQRITQINAFVWLMVGILESRAVCLSRVACKIPGAAKLTSITRRLSRLLDNPAIRVREWYEPIARGWLQAQFQSLGEIRLIVEGTKIGFSHQMLIVCLAYRRRAIPIAWTWVKHVRGTARPGSSWLCWPTCASCFPKLRRSFWWATASLGRWKSCASWMPGAGGTFCARRAIRTSGWTS